MDKVVTDYQSGAELFIRHDRAAGQAHGGPSPDPELPVGLSHALVPGTRQALCGAGEMIPDRIRSQFPLLRNGAYCEKCIELIEAKGE
jgi:hypothetical protein